MRWKALKEAFIRCHRENRLRAGHQLSTSSTAPTATTTTANHSGVGPYARSGARDGTRPETTSSLTAEKASTIVTQLSQAKFPDSTSHSWVTTTTAAAHIATGCGARRRTGTTSWVTWLARTSTLCSGPGRWWKNQLSGPGIGWVSWW